VVFHPQGPTFLELARQALSSTDRGYDLLAPKFDYTPFRTPDAILERSLDVVGEVDSGLDLCCGTGAALHVLRRHCTREVAGIDRSAGMLEVARERGEAEDGPPVELVQGDALALPDSLKNRFDVVTCYGAFGHIVEEDEPRLVRSAWDALRPGGRFVFVTSERPPPTSPALWVSLAFNAAMRLRNAVLKPEFIMYYLTFLVPRARELLVAQGFEVEVQRDRFDAPFARAVNVVATRPAG